MTLTKDLIVIKAKQDGIEKVFKSGSESCYSLTETGFEYCKQNSNNTYILKTDMIKPKDIILANKVLKSPYYLNIKKNEIWHFDEMLHIQSIFYKNDLTLFLESLI